MSGALTTTNGDGSGGLLAFIERAARDPEFDVAKFRELLIMRREEVDAQAKREFNEALRNAQAEMDPVTRDARNDHTSSMYARLETIDIAMRPIYTAHGFSIRFGSGPPIQPGWIRITCTVAHVGGYSEDHFLDGPPDAAGARGNTNKTPVQAVGATITYLRRYLLSMVFNIVLVGQDDDGEGRRARRKPQDDTAPPDDPLREANGTKWLVNLSAVLAGAEKLDDVAAIRGHENVQRVLKTAPAHVRRDVEAEFRKAYERLAPQTEDEGAAGFVDPIADLLREVEAMDLVTLKQLPTNAAWRKRVHDACSFPPDEDRLNEAITERQKALTG